MHRIGVFPRALDPLMIHEDKLTDSIFYYLVARDTKEDEWTRTFLPKSRILYYELDVNHPQLTHHNTESLLQFSDVTDIVSRNNIDTLLITNKSTPIIEEWGQKNHVGRLSTSFDIQRKFEDKLWFDTFLKQNKLPKPESIHSTLFNNEIDMQGPLVIQKTMSSGSEGTYIIKNKTEISALLQRGVLNENETYLIRSFIKGKTYGISVFISHGIISLSAIRKQCFIKDKTTGDNIFVGVQWIPFALLSQKIVRSLNEIFLTLGEILYSSGFWGFANIDFMVDDNENIYIIECNPRLSSATPHLFAVSELAPLDIGSLFINDFFNKTPFPKKKKLYSMPKSNFEGSLLDITLIRSKPEVSYSIKREYPIGLYKVDRSNVKLQSADIRKSVSAKEKNFILYSEVKKGEKYPTEGDIETIASFYSHYPLYDLNGALNSEGQYLLDNFDYIH